MFREWGVSPGGRQACLEAHDIIQNNFAWSDTVEGFDFWMMIDEVLRAIGKGREIRKSNVSLLSYSGDIVVRFEGRDAQLIRDAMDAIDEFAWVSTPEGTRFWSLIHVSLKETIYAR